MGYDDYDEQTYVEKEYDPNAKLIRYNLEVVLKKLFETDIKI